GLRARRAERGAAVGARPAWGDDGINRERFVPVQQNDDPMRAARQREMVVIAVEVVDRSHLHPFGENRPATWLDGELQSTFGSLAGGEGGARSGSNAIKLVAEVPQSDTAIEHER